MSPEERAAALGLSLSDEASTRHWTRLIAAAIREAIDEGRAAIAAERWGVWCCNEGQWCMTGTRDEAERAIPDWANGKTSALKPDDARRFRYEIRKVVET